jgi:hypothetical protein
LSSLWGRRQQGILFQASLVLSFPGKKQIKDLTIDLNVTLTAENWYSQPY